MRGRSDNDCSTSAHAHYRRDTLVPGDNVADDDDSAVVVHFDNAGDDVCIHRDSAGDYHANGADLRGTRSIEHSPQEPVRHERELIL